MTNKPCNIENRISRTMQLLSDIDILVEDLSELCLRDANEYLIIKTYRDSRKASLIKQAQTTLGISNDLDKK